MNSTSKPEIKRVVNKKQLAFLKKELSYWKENSMISDQDFENLNHLYKPAEIIYSPILLGLGAVLIGLGLLSFIAANWMSLSRLSKIMLIIGGYILSVASSWRMEPVYPRLARAALLLSSFIYGGGIFLISQMFHEGGHYSQAIFYWIIGIIPVTFLFKDRMQLLLIQALAFIYINSLPENVLYREGKDFLVHILGRMITPFPQLPLLFALWALWLYTDSEWKMGLRISVLFTLNWFVLLIFRVTDQLLPVLSLLAFSGILLSSNFFGYWKKNIKDLGIVLLGLSVLLLSIPKLWGRTEFEAFLALLFALSGGGALLYFVREGVFMAAPFLCLLILRYFFDVFYDFMPKALFFTILGILLVGMGYCIERTRKKRNRPSAIETGGTKL